MNHYLLFVHTDHPSHRNGGMNDCLGVFDSYDDALDAGAAHLQALWALPNDTAIGYIEIFDTSTLSYAKYKRYREEPSSYYDKTIVVSHIKKETGDDCPY